MKMHSKKGFTIVELVIVIAVIAILAAVMVPTFSGIVNKAKASSAEQAAANAMKVVLVQEGAALSKTAAHYYVIVDNSYWFEVNREDGNKLVSVKPADVTDKEVDAIDTVYVEKTVATTYLTYGTGFTTPTTLADLGKVVVWVDMP